MGISGGLRMQAQTPHCLQAPFWHLCYRRGLVTLPPVGSHFTPGLSSSGTGLWLCWPGFWLGPSWLRPELKEEELLLDEKCTGCD